MIPIPREYYKIHILCPLSILLLSILSLIDSSFNLSLSLLNSFIGIISFGLFILKIHTSISMFYVWGLSQLVVVSPYINSTGDEYIFNMTQYYLFGFGIYLTDKISLTINLIAIIYLVLIRIIEITYEKIWWENNYSNK